MKSPLLLRRQVLALLVLFTLGTLVSGCGSKSQVVLDPGIFKSAPPALQQQWQAAAEQAARNNYLGAATNLMALKSQSQSLTPEQSNALEQAWARLGNQAFQAANRGDKNATEAVLKMREASPGNPRGRL